MRIDDDSGALLEQAIRNVAMRNLIAELRQAVVLGPKVLGDIYAEFQHLQQEKQDDDGHGTDTPCGGTRRAHGHTLYLGSDAQARGVC